MYNISRRHSNIWRWAKAYPPQTYLLLCIKKCKENTAQWDSMCLQHFYFGINVSSGDIYLRRYPIEYLKNMHILYKIIAFLLKTLSYTLLMLVWQNLGHKLTMCHIKRLKHISIQTSFSSSLSFWNIAKLILTIILLCLDFGIHKCKGAEPFYKAVVCL